MSNNKKAQHNKASPKKVKSSQAKQAPKKHVPRQARQTTSQSYLSPCVRDYAQALVDPFDGPLACVPSSYPPIPTFKTRVWARGTFSTGTQGVGFVLVNPYRIFANDGSGVCKSETTYAQSGFPVSSGDVGVTIVNPNAPYSTAQISETNTGIQFRIVSVGARVWYVGSELNLQGEYFALRHPDNESLLSITSSLVLGFPSARRAVITNGRAPIDVTWIPMKPKDLEFNGTLTPGLSSLGILGTGPNGSANIFAYEVYGIVEYIGYGVPARTPSSADPAGFAAVLTAAQSEGDTWYGSARDAAASLLSHAKSAVTGLSGSSTGRAIMRVGAGMALNAFLPGLPAVGQTLPSAGTVTIEDADTPEFYDAKQLSEAWNPAHDSTFSKTAGAAKPESRFAIQPAPREIMYSQPGAEDLTHWIPVWIRASNH
jgi:hypothetical protein